MPRSLRGKVPGDGISGAFTLTVADRCDDPTRRPDLPAEQDYWNSKQTSLNALMLTGMLATRSTTTTAGRCRCASATTWTRPASVWDVAFDDRAKRDFAVALVDSLAGHASGR